MPLTSSMLAAKRRPPTENTVTHCLEITVFFRLAWDCSIGGLTLSLFDYTGDTDVKPPSDSRGACPAAHSARQGTTSVGDTSQSRLMIKTSASSRKNSPANHSR